jgi:hypothetical protein
LLTKFFTEKKRKKEHSTTEWKKKKKTSQKNLKMIGKKEGKRRYPKNLKKKKVERVKK